MGRISMNQSLRLAELLAARLCHDLSGPLNTLGGVLELARDDPRMLADAVAEAGAAAVTLTRRLRLLRAAWGGLGDPLSTADLTLLSDGLPGNRLRIDLDGLQPRMFEAAAARLVLNVLLLGAGCLPFGGVVALSTAAGHDVIATIDGPRAGWPQGFAALLADLDLAWQSLALIDPRDLQAAITTLVAQESGLRVSFLMAGRPQDAPPLLLSLAAG
jgi:histidine phosphotransferase ChpT